MKIYYSTDIDSVKDLREALIKRRDNALNNSEMEDAILFSHIISILYSVIKHDE